MEQEPTTVTGDQATPRDAPARTIKPWDEILADINERRRINIENAIIEVGTTLRHGSIAGEFSLRNCVVRGQLAINHVAFLEAVSFIDTVFEDGLDLSGCMINAQLTLQGVQCKVETNLEGVTVAGHAYFSNSTFEGRPNFTTASFGAHCSFKNVVFEGETFFLSANFTGNLLFEEKCRFLRSCDFTWMAVRGVFGLSGSIVMQAMNMLQIQVGGTILLTGNEFQEQASLSLAGARVGGELRIQKCKFEKSSGACLNAENVQVQGGYFMTEVTCRGKFSASNARIVPYFQIGSVPETGQEDKPDSSFDGAVDLGNLQVDGYFVCSAVTVNEKPDLTGLRIAGDMYLTYCNFKNGLKLNRSNIRGVFGTNARYGDVLECQGGEFHGGVRFLPGCVLSGGADFYFCQFDGEANFGGATVKRFLSLRNTHFRQSLLFNLPYHNDAAVRFDDQPTRVALELKGCTYETIELPEESREANTIYKFVDRIPASDAESIEYLEGWLRRSGMNRHADSVRVYRYGQRGQKLHFWSDEWSDWLLDRVYRYSTNYGTVVWLVFLAAVVTGVAAVAVELLAPEGRKAVAHAVAIMLATVAGFAVSMIVETMKRRIWPQ